jgi:hypothetical protein
MPAAAVPAIIGAVGGVGSALISKGKSTNPQAQKISDQMANYISGGMNKPIPYANVNPMATGAMDWLSRMFLGQNYSQPSYGMSAPGGGPTGMGMPQYPYGQGMSQYPYGQQPYGMPSQMGPQTPYGFPQRQFYGARGQGQR